MARLMTASNLDAVWGFAFGFPGGVGAQTAYVDQVEIVVVNDPTQVATSAQTSVTEVVVGERIGWDTRDWTLLWSDEFDGAAGTAITGESWTCEVGGHGWGNNEMEYYTDRTENVALDGDGHLIITAREESLDGTSCHYGECLYTSARCITQDKVEFTYGRVEARIDIPAGQGIWSAFWMLGANFPNWVGRLAERSTFWKISENGTSCTLPYMDRIIVAAASAAPSARMRISTKVSMFTRLIGMSMLSAGMSMANWSM